MINFNIYIIKNNINNKIYIGQTNKKIKERFSEHKWPSSQCIKLKRAIKKHGKENFYIELICACNTQEFANFLEIFYISDFNSIKKGYNITCGGDRGPSWAGKKHTELSKLKMSLSKKGIIRSEEHKRKLSQALIGRIMPDDVKFKISKSLIGNTHSVGRILTEEHKKKISDKLKGRIISEETKIKMSKNNSGEGNARAKLTWEIVNLIRKEYADDILTQKELGIKYNISRESVTNIINNKRWIIGRENKFELDEKIILLNNNGEI